MQQKLFGLCVSKWSNILRILFLSWDDNCMETTYLANFADK